jgi:D-amino-acid oxidase
MKTGPTLTGSRVTVLGAGVTGLTTAITLLDAGCEVHVVTASPIESSTSYLAAAVWFPTHVGPPELVASWGRHTYQIFADQARNGVPGVVMRQSLALYRQPPGRPDWVASVGQVRPASAAELPPGYTYGLRYAVPLVEMPLYLPWLLEQLRARGGEIQTRRVSSLDELLDGPADAVVNCSGLAARDLLGDLTVYPVRGQIVRVTNPGLTLSVRDEYHPGGRAYVHPRAEDCILGGTLEEHSWDTRVDLATAQAIIARCTDIVPKLAEASIIEHIVGLRPGRPAVRLEESTTSVTSPRIIHNYGHGGAGITLSWGCARDVLRVLLGNSV